MCRERADVHSPIKDENGRWISSHVINQDIIAWVGQGRIADRTKETLGASDLGIAMMRKRLFDELDAVARGAEPKAVFAIPMWRARLICPTSPRRPASKASRLKSTKIIRCSRFASKAFAIVSVSHRKCAAPSRKRWGLRGSE